MKSYEKSPASTGESLGKSTIDNIPRRHDARQAPPVRGWRRYTGTRLPAYRARREYRMKAIGPRSMELNLKRRL